MTAFTDKLSAPMSSRHTNRHSDRVQAGAQVRWIDRTRLGTTLSTLNGLMDTVGMLAVAGGIALLIQAFSW